MTTTPEEIAPAADSPIAAPAAATGISTERLQLDAISSAEVDALIIQSRLPDWADDFPQPMDHDAARQFFEEGLSTAGAPLTTRLIRERGTAQVVGSIGFLPLSEQGSVEVSYSVVPSRRGRGYATEAVVALVRLVLEQPDVEQVTASTEVENAASQSLLLSAGFLPVEGAGLSLGFVLRRTQLPDAAPGLPAATA